MYARRGDRIVFRRQHPGGAFRDAEVLDVEHRDGSPPYLVRWTDTGREELLFPDSHAFVDHDAPSYPPEYELEPVTG